MRKSLLTKIAKQGDTFTINEVAKVTNFKRRVLWVLLHRLEKNGWIERIEKGKYLLIPLGEKKGEYTINEFIIGSMLTDKYAISYWSALHYHGLTEQIPKTVFIQTTNRRKNQNTNIFGIPYKIIRIKQSKFFGIQKALIEKN